MINIDINQKAVMRLRDKTGVKLDLVDVSLLDFFTKFSHTGKMDTILVGNRAAYRVTYSRFIEEMPLLEIENTRSMARRFAKLCDAKILFLEMVNNNTPYFGFGENYIHLSPLMGAFSLPKNIF
jgi:hypothetical protein